MPEKKKQHYVPKFYMRFFSNNQNQFSLLTLSNKIVRSSVPIGTQCYKDYFYGKNSSWEDILADMENEWNTTFGLIHNYAQLNDELKSSLKSFAVYQRQRTLGEYNYSNSIQNETINQCAKSYCNKKGWKYTEELERKIINGIENEITPSELLYYSNQICYLIDDLDVLVINYKTKRRLVSSDVPIIIINPFEEHSIGFGCIGIVIMYPISPNQLVVIYDSKMYPKYKGKYYVDLYNENEVCNLNVLQLISAEKILFSDDRAALSSFTYNHWEEREKNRNKRNVQALGSEDNKLLYNTLRTCIYKYTFSFASICKDFSSIPYYCREAVPRQYEKEWQNKLETKIQIMPQIRNIIPDMKIIFASNKELRKGYKMMLDTAKKYWNYLN